MQQLVSLLTPIIIAVVVALVIVLCAERFSPDEFITKLVKYVVFGVLLIYLLTKFIPLLGI